MAVGPIANRMFTGVATLTPYYRLYTEKLYDNGQLIKLLNKIHPHYMAASEWQERDPEWKAKWGELDEDKVYENKFTARTASLWIEEQKRVEKSIDETETPFLFIVAENDGVVRNDVIE